MKSGSAGERWGERKELKPKLGKIDSFAAASCCLLVQYRIQSCDRGERRVVEDMCNEIERSTVTTRHLQSVIQLLLQKPLLSMLRRGATPCYHYTLIKRGKPHSLINTIRHVEGVW